MDNNLSENLQAEGLISRESSAKIKFKNANPLFSVHWELKTLLYLGVMLLSTGLGILIYKNIDTIGHQAILLFIAAICGGCFIYCFRLSQPFSLIKTEPINAFYDYILLLGCLTFLSFVGYLQFQFNVFGTNYRLATFIPMLVLFFTAYYFDHLGVLSLGITNLAVWMGLSVTPTRILQDYDFSSDRIIYTSLLLGIILLSAAFFSERFNIKKHFQFTYQNFGLHITFISLLSGYYFFESLSSLRIIGLAAIAYFYYHESLKNRSFYFLLIITLYSYIAISSVIMRTLFDDLGETALLYLALMYLIGSSIGVILFLINLNKKLKQA